jgi:hypothetical protein
MGAGSPVKLAIRACICACNSFALFAFSLASFMNFWACKLKKRQKFENNKRKKKEKKKQKKTEQWPFT